MKIKNIIQKISSYRKYIIGVAIVLCLSVGAYMTISYLTSDSSLENTFTIASVQPTVVETFENDVKSNVYVKNNGDIPVYIRAKIMIYYQNQNKNRDNKINQYRNCDSALFSHFNLHFLIPPRKC